MDQSVRSSNLGGRGDVERSLRRIVRTVIRRGHGASRLSQQILAIANSLPKAGRTLEQVVNLVCSELSHTLAGGPSAEVFSAVPQLETTRRQFDTATSF